MTTITINNEKDITKTKFENIDELLVYFMDKKGYGSLIPIDEKNITQEQNLRFQKAINTPKSKMYNI